MKSGELSSFIAAMVALIGMLMCVYAARRRPPDNMSVKKPPQSTKSET